MSKFSDFIRNASPDEKEKVYTEVMDKASAAQRATVSSTRPTSRELLQEARSRLLLAWERSNQGALGSISAIITNLDAEIEGRPLADRSARGTMLTPAMIVAGANVEPPCSAGEFIERFRAAMVASDGGKAKP